MGWPRCPGGCIVCSRFRASLSQLDWPSFSVPLSQGVSERGKVWTLHFDSLDSSGFPAVADLLFSCAWAFLAQVKGKPGPTWPHVNWLQWSSQVHCIHWRYQCACYEQCQGRGCEQKNRKVRSHDKGKINREKSVGLRPGSWKGCTLLGTLFWRDCLCKILSFWFCHDLQLEKNWSEVL